MTPNWGRGPSILYVDPFPAFSMRSSQRRIAVIFRFRIASSRVSDIGSPNFSGGGLVYNRFFTIYNIRIKNHRYTKIRAVFFRYSPDRARNGYYGTII